MSDSIILTPWLFCFSPLVTKFIFPGDYPKESVDQAISVRTALGDKMLQFEEPLPFVFDEDELADFLIYPLEREAASVCYRIRAETIFEVQVQPGQAGPLDSTQGILLKLANLNTKFWWLATREMVADSRFSCMRRCSAARNRDARQLIRTTQLAGLSPSGYDRNEPAEVVALNCGKRHRAESHMRHSHVPQIAREGHFRSASRGRGLPVPHWIVVEGKHPFTTCTSLMPNDYSELTSLLGDELSCCAAQADKFREADRLPTSRRRYRTQSVTLDWPVLSHFGHPEHVRTTPHHYRRRSIQRILPADVLPHGNISCAGDGHLVFNDSRDTLDVTSLNLKDEIILRLRVAVHGRQQLPNSCLRNEFLLDSDRIPHWRMLLFVMKALRRLECREERSRLASDAQLIWLSVLDGAAEKRADAVSLSFRNSNGDRSTMDLSQVDTMAAAATIAAMGNMCDGRDIADGAITVSAPKQRQSAMTAFRKQLKRLRQRRPIPPEESRWSNKPAEFSAVDSANGRSMSNNNFDYLHDSTDPTLSAEFVHGAGVLPSMSSRFTADETVCFAQRAAKSGDLAVTASANEVCMEQEESLYDAKVQQLVADLRNQRFISPSNEDMLRVDVTNDPTDLIDGIERYLVASCETADGIYLPAYLHYLYRICTHLDGRPGFKENVRQLLFRLIHQERVLKFSPFIIAVLEGFIGFAFLERDVAALVDEYRGIGNDRLVQLIDEYARLTSWHHPASFEASAPLPPLLTTDYLTNRLRSITKSWQVASTAHRRALPDETATHEHQDPPICARLVSALERESEQALSRDVAAILEHYENHQARIAQRRTGISSELANVGKSAKNDELLTRRSGTLQRKLTIDDLVHLMFGGKNAECYRYWRFPSRYRRPNFYEQRTTLTEFQFFKGLRAEKKLSL